MKREGRQGQEEMRRAPSIACTAGRRTPHVHGPTGDSPFYAYRFIQTSTEVKLPSPVAIGRLCFSYKVSPALEQQECCFLNYAKTILNVLTEHERIATVMMDEIHIQAHFDYKGGDATGAAANGLIPAKARVFTLQSLPSNHKDVHILPIAQIDTKALHEFLRKLITQPEDSE